VDEQGKGGQNGYTDAGAVASQETLQSSLAQTCCLWPLAVASHLTSATKFLHNTTPTALLYELVVQVHSLWLPTYPVCTLLDLTFSASAGQVLPPA
jgi:hypothetical protein